MLCGKCGNKNPSFSLYCEHCGAQIAEQSSQPQSSLQNNSFQNAQQQGRASQNQEYNQSLHQNSQKEDLAQLKEYIKSCLEAGHAMAQIKRALQREGYEEEEIQQAFIQAHKEEHELSKNHPLSSSNHEQNENNTRTGMQAKHTAVMFIALVVVILFGGFIMLEMNKDTVGLATLATQQQQQFQEQQRQDLVGNAMTLISNQIKGELDTTKKELMQRVEMVDEKVAKITFEQEEPEPELNPQLAFAELLPDIKPKTNVVSDTDDSFFEQESEADILSKLTSPTAYYQNTYSTQQQFSSPFYRKSQLVKPEAQTDSQVEYDTISSERLGEPKILQELSEKAPTVMSEENKYTDPSITTDIKLKSLTQEDIGKTARLKDMSILVSSPEKIICKIKVNVYPQHPRQDVPPIATEQFSSCVKLAGNTIMHLGFPETIRWTFQYDHAYYLELLLYNTLSSSNDGQSLLIARQIYEFKPEKHV